MSLPCQLVEVGCGGNAFGRPVLTDENNDRRLFCLFYSVLRPSIHGKTEHYDRNQCNRTSNCFLHNVTSSTRIARMRRTSVIDGVCSASTETSATQFASANGVI